MPSLIGFLDPAPDAPGFVIPFFRDRPRSNSDLVQCLGQDGRIAAFSWLLPPEPWLRASDDSLTAELGGPALFAFKDHTRSVHVGDLAAMRTIAANLLEDPGLLPWPLIRLELGSFRDGDLPDPELLQAAYHSVTADDGEMAAEVWRDTQVFTPAVRSDVARSPSRRQRPDLPEVLAMLTSQGLEVFVEPGWLQQLNVIDWARTRRVLQAFQVEADIVIHESAGRQPGGDVPATWAATGIGGVAEYVLLRPPFHGGASRGGTFQAEAPVLPGPGASQLIYVCQSDPRQVAMMVEHVRDTSPADGIRHLVNIRPFGFGTRSLAKMPVEALPQVAAEFEHVWAVSGHRQRRTGETPSQLSVTNAASRHVRLLLQSIHRRADVVTEMTRDERLPLPSFNLFGSVRSQIEWAAEEAVRNLLHTMLTEDAPLRSAKRIVAFSPSHTFPDHVSVDLGGHRYNVEIRLDERQPASSRDLMGWAFGLQPSRRSLEDLSELAAGLLEGYGWRLSEDRGAVLKFHDGQEELRVGTGHDAQALRGMKAALEAESVDVVLTWMSVRNEWRHWRRKETPSLIHYADLGRWMAKRHGKHRFGLSAQDDD